ncbi:MAG: DUF2798 domain-containing protein [Clostridium perfringens]|nr:DUF2798 domain-containing protein [Clostridium perfringens]
MPKTKFQQLFFAFLTVLITVHLFVFYNLVVNPKEDKPYIVNIAITCSTICLMCPMMSFVSALLFKGFNSELIANWLQNIVINFPFAFFTQLFLIQPFVRFVFRNVFKNQLNNDKCIVNEA